MPNERNARIAVVLMTTEEVAELSDLIAVHGRAATVSGLFRAAMEEGLEPIFPKVKTKESVKSLKARIALLESQLSKE